MAPARGARPAGRPRARAHRVTALAAFPRGGTRRIVYLGTPELAVAPLDALLAAGVEVALVVTRPDVRRGRGSATTPSPVKARALARGIPVTSDVHDVLGLADAGPIAGVVVAFGERIPDEVLARVPMLNLHFSLLPRWRGAAPVERAILAGDAETGACVMSVVPEMDAGPVHASARTAIGPGDTTESLRSRLLALGVPLLVAAVRDGVGEGEPQRGAPVHAAKIRAADLRLDWSRPAVELARVVRVGGAYATLPSGARLGVRSASAGAVDAAMRDAAPGTLGVGTVDGGDAILVRVGDGVLALREVQPEGRGAMDAGAWWRGARLAPGDRLG